MRANFLSLFEKRFYLPGHFLLGTLLISGFIFVDLVYQSNIGPRQTLSDASRSMATRNDHFGNEIDTVQKTFEAKKSSQYQDCDKKKCAQEPTLNYSRVWHLYSQFEKAGIESEKFRFFYAYERTFINGKNINLKGIYLAYYPDKLSEPFVFIDSKKIFLSSANINSIKPIFSLSASQMKDRLRAYQEKI